MFILSGATAIAYEVLWFKRLSHVWGNSSIALATVVVSYLLGLGLGARLFGVVAERASAPLRLYATCEFGIGIWAAIFPWVLGVVHAGFNAVHSCIGESQLLITPLRIVLTLIVLGPPCVLMGATLPLLIRAMRQQAPAQHDCVAWLYAVNTLGAAAGTCVFGFYVIPEFGLMNANWLAISANLALGSIAMALSLRHSRATQAANQGCDCNSNPGPDLWHGLRDNDRSTLGVVALVAALSGAGSLILQLSWTRQIALMVGGSTYAFSGILFIVLLGIGLGSLLCHISQWLHSHPLGGAVLASSVIICFSCIGQVLIPGLSELMGHLRLMRASLGINAALIAIVSTILAGIPAIAMGVILPCLIRYTGESTRRPEVITGKVYNSNILGSAVGGLVTFPLLIPTLGVYNTVSAGISLYALVAVVLLWKGCVRSFAPYCAIASITCASVLVLMRGHDPLLTDRGLYLYGMPSKREARTLFHKAGSSCNVLVTDLQGVRALYVNGKVDATSSGDMPTQVGLAVLPMILRPNSRSILVIGYGSGTTVGTLLSFAGASVTCAELEPSVYAAAHTFASVNSWPHDPQRFSVVFDDGRSFLNSRRNRYDLIVSEPSNPWIAGVTNLFTREFYCNVAASLSEDGLFVQWAQAYNFTVKDYVSILATLNAVFPQIMIARIRGGDTIIMGSMRPIELTASSLDAAQARIDHAPNVKRALEEHLNVHDARTAVLRHIIGDQHSVQRLVARHGGEVITDHNMRLEYEAPRHLFAANVGYANIDRELMSECDTNALEVRIGMWGWSNEQLEGLRYLEELFAKYQLRVQLVRLCDIGVRIAPKGGYFRTRKFLYEGTFGQEFLASFRELAGDSVGEATRVGVDLWKLKCYREATDVFSVLVERNPSSATALANLGVNYHALGEHAKAVECLKRALAVDPSNDFAVKTYKAIAGVGISDNEAE